METIQFLGYIESRAIDHVIVKFYDGVSHTARATIQRDALQNFQNLIPSSDKHLIIGYGEKTMKIERDGVDTVTITFNEFFSTGGRDSTGATPSKTQLKLKELN